MIEVSRTSARDFVASQLFADCYWSPTLWATKVMNFMPHPWQWELGERITANLRAGIGHNQVVLKKAHGVGGTAAACWLTGWFMATRRGSKGIDTAPTHRQVQSVFWPTFREQYGNSILPRLGFGTALDTKMSYGENWFFEGVATDRDYNAEGYHSPTGVCLVFDEAKGIRDSVWESFTGTLTTAESLRINSSTPGFEFGKFFELWTRPAGPDVIKIDIPGSRGLAEGIPGMAVLEKELRENWGDTSDAYASRWNARFMREQKGGIIPWADVERAMQRHDAIRAGVVTPGGPRHSSLDIAASDSGDKSVLGNFIGNDLIEVHAWQLRNTREMEREAFMRAKAWEAVRFRGDAPGLGRPVIDGISEAAKKSAPGMKVEEYWEGGKPTNAAGDYDDRHTEAVNVLARKLRDGKVALPRFDAAGEPIPWKQLLQYRQAPNDDHRYHVVKAGKNEKSPDYGDMLAIGLAPDAYSTADALLEAYQRQRAARDEARAQRKAA